MVDYVSLVREDFDEAARLCHKARQLPRDDQNCGSHR